MNRAKYTEASSPRTSRHLPEFADSADTHFDSVRPINHAYIDPGGLYAEAESGRHHRYAGSGSPAGSGQDPDQHLDDQVSFTLTGTGSALSPV